MPFTVDPLGWPQPHMPSSLVGLINPSPPPHPPLLRLKFVSSTADSWLCLGLVSTASPGWKTQLRDNDQHTAPLPLAWARTVLVSTSYPLFPHMCILRLPSSDARHARPPLFINWCRYFTTQPFYFGPLHQVLQLMEPSHGVR
jgi:hypothetical protein